MLALTGSALAALCHLRESYMPSQAVPSLWAKSRLQTFALALACSIANWSDANPNRLEPHEPEPTDIVVTLGSKH
jgi:hypothetical protein